ncbi:hypothetical protein ACKWTF_009395 [Chironomus riparius]
MSFNEEEVLLLCESDNEFNEELDDSKHLNSETLILKFITKSANKINSFTSAIHKLLTDNKVQIKGLYSKGEQTLLIEVLLTTFLEMWLHELVGERNNACTLSDKVKKDIMKNVFGKFNLILVNLIFVPGIEERLMKCKSSFYPFGPVMEISLI